jgi:hypothetical protein
MVVKSGKAAGPSSFLEANTALQAANTTVIVSSQEHLIMGRYGGQSPRRRNSDSGGSPRTVFVTASFDGSLTSFLYS